MSPPRLVVALIALALLGAGGQLAAQADGSLRWGFSSGGFIDSSPVVGADGTIYIGVRIDSTPNRGRMLAVRRDGSLKWQFPAKPTDPQIDWVESSPAISADGTVIYFGCWDGKLYALNTADGTKKWDYDTRAFAVFSSPTLASDGTIYIVSGDLILHAVTKDGLKRWTHPAGSLFDSAPAIGGDGTLYFGANDQNIYALNPDGTEKWRTPVGAAAISSPAIGADGTIYLGASDNSVLAVAPEGALKWRFIAGDLIVSSPSLGADGTIYFGSLDQQFYAVNPDGRQKWKTNVRAAIASTAAVRGDGTIIFGAADNLIHALNPDGTGKWAFPTGDLVESSPVVALDGSIYVGSFDGKLYSLNGTIAPLSTMSSWPMFNHDAAHNGRTTIASGNAYLVNLSTLAPLAGGATNLIAGLVVRGSAPKNFLIRAVGPTLGHAFNVPGTLSDPSLSLVSQSGPEIAANNNWGDDLQNVVLATNNAMTFQLGLGEKDSALAVALVPGNYSAVVRSVDGGVGAALVEAYDLQAGSGASRLVNISTRAQSSGPVGPLTAGLVIGGSGSLRVLIRAIGPGLAQFGVSGFLTQPRLRVFDASNTLVGTYAGWVASGLTEDLAVAARQTGAFALSPIGAAAADAAAVVTLVPGLYTIQVSGVDGGAGEALVEVYVLP